MTKEFYNELLDKRLITDTKMSFEYIQENNIPLCEIITIPAVLQEILKNYEQVDMKEDTIDSPISVINETSDLENTPVVEPVVEPTVEPVVEPAVEPVVEPVVEAKEEIVVDEPEEEEKPKNKKN